MMQAYERLTPTIKKTAAVYGTILLFSAALGLIYLLRALVLQLVVALILAMVLSPLVLFLMRRGLGRAGASFCAILIALGSLFLIIGVIATPLVTEGTRLVSNVPDIATNLVQNPTLASLNQKYHIIDQLKQSIQAGAGKLAGAGLPLIGVFGSIVDGASAAIIIFIFAFFLLLEGPVFWEKIVATFPDSQALRLRRTADKISRAISGFVTGNLLISLIAGSVGLITMLLLDIPYAFALAALLALFDLIPLVGAALGTIAIALVALTQGFLATLIVVIVLLIYQFIEGHVIQPIVYSRAIALSPLIIILASVIGAELGGVVGVLLAIPAASMIQIIGTELVHGSKQQA